MLYILRIISFYLQQSPYWNLISIVTPIYTQLPVHKVHPQKLQNVLYERPTCSLFTHSKAALCVLDNADTFKTLSKNITLFCFLTVFSEEKNQLLNSCIWQSRGRAGRGLSKGYSFCTDNPTYSFKERKFLQINRTYTWILILIINAKNQLLSHSFLHNIAILVNLLS